MTSIAPMHTVASTVQSNYEKARRNSRTQECATLFIGDRRTSPEAQRAAALQIFALKLQSTAQRNTERRVQKSFTRWQECGIQCTSPKRSADVSINATAEDDLEAGVAAQSVEQRSGAADAANKAAATSSKVAFVPSHEESADQLQCIYTIAAADQSVASSAEPEAAELQCLICMEQNSMKNMYTIACGHADHTYCVDCIAQHCGTQLLDMGFMPRCPGRDCQYELTRAQLTAVWAVSMHIV
jgi:hypothetical protein